MLDSSIAPVICLGEVLVDRLFQATPGLALKSWMDYPGGAPANVAAALTKLGTPACFVGCLGKDAQGDFLIRYLENQGVLCQVQRHLTAPTRTVLVRRGEGGERQFIGFSAGNGANCYADAYLSPNYVEQITFGQASFIVMGTLGLAAEITGSAMERALRQVQQRSGFIVIDVNWRPIFWSDVGAASQKILTLLQQANLLKASSEEAQWLFQTDQAPKIQQRLPKTRVVVITHGANGCSYATSKHNGHISAFEVESEDTTGAGDAFLAGVVHQLHQQGMEALEHPQALYHLLRYASAVGALTTLRPGAMDAQPTHQEVEAFLYLHPETKPQIS